MMKTMKRFVLSSLGLVALSAAGGAVLFASHSALAAGPRLPDYVSRVHAVAASRPVAGAALVTVALRTDETANDFASDTGAGSAFDTRAETVSNNPVTETQRESRTISVSAKDDPAADIYLADLAPYRTLRPLARPDQPETVAVVTPPRQATTTAPRRVVTAPRVVQIAPVPQPVPQPVLRTSVAPQRNAGMDANYFHGVFR